MSARPRNRGAADATTLPVLLGRVATELGARARDVNDLQVKLGPVLAELASESHHLSADIQRLDLLAQSLASLSAFVQGLGASCGAGAPVDPAPLAEALPLRDLAERLCGRAVVDEAKDLELF
ncbi:MAG TPA: hypothetical protein VH414_12145 [Lichenihabitans sp.]|nr:hypothetical protein [Lichenihabitans sp.]